jgi:hypothetical protein
VTVNGLAVGKIAGRRALQTCSVVIWNREPLEIARLADLGVIAAWRTFFGIFHLIEAQP